MSVLEAAGAQMPAFWSAPEVEASSAAQEALELVESVGLELDAWQRFVLEQSLGERSDGTWSATEVGLCVPRQNGKDVVLEARELAGLAVLGEKLIIHSAQQLSTSREHFRRMLELLEGAPDYLGRVQRVVRTNGEEGIHMRSGQRIRFFTRSKSGGRGFSADLVVFNEAMFLAESSLGALLPTQAAMPNRQRWYVGSAVDQFVHPDGVVFARVRERGLAGDDPRLAYFEWSVPVERPSQLTDDQVADRELWARSNPGFGIRIGEDAIEDELRSLDRRSFAVERLGVGDWPPTDPDSGAVISPAAWVGLVDRSSSLQDPVCLAFDVTPDRAFASVAAAGRREDGLAHVEVVEHRQGTDWLPARLLELEARHQPAAVLCDRSGPVASLVDRLVASGLELTEVSAADHAKACGQLVDLVAQDRLRHLGDGDLLAAVKGATRRPLGDAWAWSRRSSAVDISPLVAATLALWASEAHADTAGDMVIW